MASVDDETINFQLVSTYVPLIILLLRSSVLVVTINFVSAVADSANFVLVLLAFLVYFDAHFFRHNRFNQACGFLCPVALCLALTHVTPRRDELAAPYAVLVLWVVDMVWAVSSSSFLGIVSFKGLFVVDVIYAAAWWALCGVVHSLFAPTAVEGAQAVLRAFVYYVLCAVYHYSRHSTVTVDRNVYKLSVGHIFWHVLLVKEYVLLGSIAACLLLFCAVYYLRYAHSLQLTTTRATARHSDNDHDTLMSELRAAKSAVVTLP